MELTASDHVGPDWKWKLPKKGSRLERSVPSGLPCQTGHGGNGLFGAKPKGMASLCDQLSRDHFNRQDEQQNCEPYFQRLARHLGSKSCSYGSGYKAP